MPVLAVSRLRARTQSSPPPDQVLRFRTCERHLHWAVALPFMVSLGTAVILVAVYNPQPDRPYRELVSSIHKISGICLIVLPLLAALVHRRELMVHFENIREVWSWSRADVRWLMLAGPAAVNPKVQLPPQGKFNAAEKINFMVLTSTYPLYILTGVLIWVPSMAILAWFLHFSMAVAATPLMVGHIFMATINRDTRVGLSGMVSGFVDRHWARHHYRLWYDRHHGKRPDVRAPVSVRPFRPAPGTPGRTLPAIRHIGEGSDRRPAGPRVVRPLNPAGFVSSRAVPRPASVLVQVHDTTPRDTPRETSAG